MRSMRPFGMHGIAAEGLSTSAVQALIDADRDGMGLYSVLDYGLTAGSSSGLAAANTTALQALWLLVAQAGGGIYFPPGIWSLNTTTLDHALGYSTTVNIQGSGGSTLLYFHGTTGPFLNIATGATSAVAYGFIRDLQLRHNDVVTSGATLQLGYAQSYLIDNVRSIYNSSDKASMTSVRLHASCTAIKFVNCKFATRADEATLTSGGLFPIGLDVAVSTGGPGGFEFHGTEFSGCVNRSTGIRWLNSILIDTAWFSGGCLIKDHETGMRFGFGNDNGGVANLIATDLIIDGITGVAVHMSPTYTGARPAVLPPDIVKDGATSVVNHQYVGCWFVGLDYGFLIDNSGAGTIYGIQVNDCYLTGSLIRSIYVSGIVSELVIEGNRVTFDGNLAGRAALDIGDGASAVTDMAITGNRVAVSGSSADAPIRINAAVDSFTVVGNVLRRGADADGIINTPGVGTSRVVANNSWKA